METALSLVGSVITGSLALVGNYFIYLKRTREADYNAAKREQRQNDRLDIIERKIDEHNGWGQKFGSFDKNLALMQKDIEYLKEAKCSRKRK